jgi:C4-dicarboxylate-specific signal transduction histidine kinase
VLRVWRQNYGYADDLLTSLALFLLSPLMALAYLVLGVMGLLLCFVPMALVRNAAKRYIALQQTQQALVWNERMAAMGEMAAEIGHELANVLQVITAQAQMLLTEPDGVRGERSKRATRLIFERAADMRRLTKGLVDFSHREVVPRQELIPRLVREAVEMVRTQARYDGIDWEVEIVDEHLKADVDGGQLRQVLVNLFRNAAEAMTGRAGSVIRVRVSPIGDRFRIEVEDNGGGFPPDFIDRVFEPWLSTKPEGHGFGLAVCYRIVRNHGGSIRAANLPAGGAAVIIELPCRRRVAQRRAA